MVPSSPTTAFGPSASGLRELLVETVRARHALMAEAHQISGSRYGMAFCSQWRDLLVDTREALKSRGFRSYKLPPGGYDIPIVNDCLVYVWRVPNPRAVSEFASSPTRMSGFMTQPPEPTLWEPDLSGKRESGQDAGDPDGTNPDDVGPVLQAVGETMPLVLVMIASTPQQLQSIEWAVAVLDAEGKVELRGQESIWKPELGTEHTAAEVESFDSGSPIGPKIEAREQEGSDPDA